MKVLSIALCLAVGVAAAASSPFPTQAALSASDRELYQQVFDAARKEKFADAERMAVQSQDRLLAKLVRWMTHISPRSGSSFEEITAFMETSEDWPQISALQRRAEESITPETPDGRILAWFDGHEPVSVDGSMAYARALLGAERKDEATKVIRSAWIEGGFGGVQERQFVERFGSFLRPADHWKRIDRLLWDRQDAGLIERLLPSVSPEQAALARARLALQDSKSSPEGAVALVPSSYKDDPGLIYDRTRWRRLKDLDEDALALLSHASSNQGRPDLWWQERSTLARRALQKGLVSEAYKAAANHGLETSSPLYPDAEFLAGWIALRFLKDSDRAETHFRQLWDNAKTVLVRSRAAYWSGRTADSTNDKSSAREWYSRGAVYLTSYYGQLSASQLRNHDWSLPADPKPTTQDTKRFNNREMTRAIRLMNEVGETRYLRPFFIRLNDTAQTPGERALIGKLALDSGRRDLAVTVARRADRDGVFLYDAGWPMMPIASSVTPERALVLALIRQESGFLADIQSPVGARGLMQLMPATAERVAKGLKVSYTPGRLDDPEFNVQLGASYLSGLLSDFEGSYILALAGYNAGPGRARRWVKDYGDPRDPSVDVVDWIEMIPFNETRTYVQRVMESVSIYRRKLGSASSASFEQDLKMVALQ